jgi:hypothetical protein
LNPRSPNGPESQEDDELLLQINKRLTLNLLIQGAAAHTFITAHHLIARELEEIRPGLVRVYDTTVPALHLNYWIGDIAIFYGWWRWFWWRTGRRSHPFHRHPLLARHGGELARAGKRHLASRAWKKGVLPAPPIHYAQMIYLLIRMTRAERGHQRELAAAAKRATAEIWGIDESRLVAELTPHVAFGHLREPRTAIGRLTRAAVVGYGGVEHDGRQFQVIGKAICLPLLLHELTKGTAELVCIHGLNSLSEEMYEQVTDEADQLEYETWLLQAGPEAWRRLLAASPPGVPIATVLMHLARLDPIPLEKMMLAVVSDPPAAKRMLSVMLE